MKRFIPRCLDESSQRMASVVTCDDLTELLVLAKEDYHNLGNVNIFIVYHHVHRRRCRRHHFQRPLT